MAQDLEDLRKWVGEKETDIDYVTIPAVHRLSTPRDRGDPVPRLGDPLRPGSTAEAEFH